MKTPYVNKILSDKLIKENNELKYWEEVLIKHKTDPDTNAYKQANTNINNGSIRIQELINVIELLKNETKEEVIKKAWGDKWDLVKNDVDENGILYFQDESEYDLDYAELTVLSRGSEWTEEAVVPTSIEGIQNNNGWFHLEELYLPIFDDKDLFEFYDLTGQYLNGCFYKYHVIKYCPTTFTHFRRIIAYKPPLY